MDIRTGTSLKFILNIVFAIYNCVLGIISHSYWFIAVGAYYVVLSVMRVSVIAFSGKNLSDDRFIMKFAGIMLFIMSIVLCGIVYMTVWHNSNVAVEYHEIVMITIALYTFIKISLAVKGMFSKRKKKDGAFKTLKSIAFTDAVVSMYSLQRSMLVSFGEVNEKDILILNVLSGIGMCVLIVLTGINLIIDKEKIMAKSKLIKANEKIVNGVTEGYKRIEKVVVDGYKKIEKGVVGGYAKIEDKFIDAYLTKDGETVEEAKKRLKQVK